MSLLQGKSGIRAEVTIYVTICIYVTDTDTVTICIYVMIICYDPSLLNVNISQWLPQGEQGNLIKILSY